MVFSSLVFVFVFLVLNLLFVLISKEIKTKNIVLVVSSLIFYAWGGPKLLILLCGMVFICYMGALLIQKEKDSGKSGKQYLVFTAILVLSLLGYFKYAGFLVYNFAAITKLAINVPNIVLPIGISFYTFQLLSYVVDVYRGEVEAQKKYWLLLLYASLFHQCIAGPIVRYKDVAENITDRKVSIRDIGYGVSRFIVGFAKKALLANTCALLADTFLPMKLASIESSSALSVLCGGIMYSFQIYLDFSAYSDMAIGMGRMIGFHYLENFNYPYMANSITDFWRRWHMSLGSFFRDYVYIPLGGNRCSIPRHIFNMFVVWGLTGMWHGASWNYILWGLYYFVLLILEKYVFRFSNKPIGAAKVLRHVFVLICTLFGWYLFRFEDMSMLTASLKGLFCLNGNKFVDGATTLVLSNYCFFIILAAIACTPFVTKIAAKMKKASETNVMSARIYAVCSVILPLILLFLSFISLIGDSYNPFLYSQF